jgi:hypothetical protein
MLDMGHMDRWMGFYRCGCLYLVFEMLRKTTTKEYVIFLTLAYHLQHIKQKYRVGASGQYERSLFGFDN